MMPRHKGPKRFKSRRAAAIVLRALVEAGGVATEYWIEELPDGGCVIVVLERDGQSVAGMLGA